MTSEVDRRLAELGVALPDAPRPLSRVLGDRAGHARSAFGASHLPADAAIELVVTTEVG